MRHAVPRSFFLVFMTAGSTLAACYVGPLATDDDRGTSARTASNGADTPDASSGGATSPSEATVGVPCDVATLLANRCLSCHGTKLTAPMALVTYGDLTKASKSDPSLSNAALALARMQDAENPMPPMPPLATEDELSPLRVWVERGTPKGAACVGARPDEGTETPAPPEAKLVCTSGQTWTGTKKGASMNPGRACIQCHTSRREDDEDDGPIVHVGGTVYPTVREPDLCFGVDGTKADVKVVITDATGRVVELPVGPTGNFALRGREAPLVFPYRAKVVADGKERVMAKPRSNGDCNACHTTTGENGAPGRIFLP